MLQSAHSRQRDQLRARRLSLLSPSCRTRVALLRMEASTSRQSASKANVDRGESKKTAWPLTPSCARGPEFSLGRRLRRAPMIKTGDAQPPFDE